ncbi:hypothetical protein AB0N38_30070 [Micromonospora aurantiaca]|uniref:hypothetical protein n=1 Tax=Micromonospora aurantiaca (nom. illeg.) TaxID=47850 RepID=UPI001E502CFE|nr:hypothetical protein [Micromonospora aurantiaca]MCY9556129.1 hypothetical protein [Paenibacillus apiarius]UFN92446.1 hypothetical protein LF814_20810 [Micromonospora aurantiaca]
MTVETRKQADPTVRTEELQRRDQVLLFGQVVEIADVQQVREFPTCVNLVILPTGGGQPRETLVPRDMLLLGLRLPRLVPMNCQGCKCVVKLPVDLAHGQPPAVLCGRCRGRIVEGTARWTQPVPAGRY